MSSRRSRQGGADHVVASVVQPLGHGCLPNRCTPRTTAPMAYAVWPPSAPRSGDAAQGHEGEHERGHRLAVGDGPVADETEHLGHRHAADLADALLVAGGAVAGAGRTLEPGGEEDD